MALLTSNRFACQDTAGPSMYPASLSQPVDRTAGRYMPRTPGDEAGYLSCFDVADSALIQMLDARVMVLEVHARAGCYRTSRRPSVRALTTKWRFARQGGQPDYLKDSGEVSRTGPNPARSFLAPANGQGASSPYPALHPARLKDNGIACPLPWTTWSRSSLKRRRATLSCCALPGESMHMTSARRSSGRASTRLRSWAFCTLRFQPSSAGKLGPYGLS